MAARQYSVCFKKDGKKFWLSRNSMTLAQARVHFQGALLDGSFAGYAMYLEPVPVEWVVDQAVKAKWLADVAGQAVKDWKGQMGQ